MNRKGARRGYRRREGLRSSRMTVESDSDDIPVVIGEKHGREVDVDKFVDLTADDANPVKLLRSDDHVGLVATIAEDEMMQTKTVARKCDEDELEDATCPVCRGLLYRPVTLECGHNLCESCMFRWMSVARGSLVCPAGCQRSLPSNLPQVNLILSNIVAKQFPGQTKEREIEEAPLVDEIKETRTLQESEPVIADIPPPAADHPHHPHHNRQLFLPIVDLPVVQRVPVKRAIDRLVAMNRVRFLVSLAISVTLLVLFGAIGRFNANPSFSVVKTIHQQWNSNLTYHDVIGLYGEVTVFLEFGYRYNSFQPSCKPFDNLGECSFASHAARIRRNDTNVNSCLAASVICPYQHITPRWFNWIFPRSSFFIDLLGLARTNQVIFFILTTMLIRKDLLKLELLFAQLASIFIAIQLQLKHPHPSRLNRVNRLMLTSAMTWVAIYLHFTIWFVVCFMVYGILNVFFHSYIPYSLAVVWFSFCLYNLGLGFPLILLRIDGGAVHAPAHVNTLHQYKYVYMHDFRVAGQEIVEANGGVTLKRLTVHCTDMASIIINSRI